MKDLNKDSIVQGDNGSELRFTISEHDLNGASVSVNIRRAGELFTKSATIIDVAKGVCEVVLNREDLMVAGIYFLQPSITYADDSEFFSDLYRFAVKGNLTYVPSQPGNGGTGFIKDSTINGNIIVNGSEIVVYDDGQILQTIAILNRLGISANNRLIIDGVEQVGGGSEEMTLVVKDYFEGSANVTKTYADSMIGFEISNDSASGGASLTFTINGLTIPVKAGEVYSGNFAPYKSVVITSTVPFRAAVSASLNSTVTPPVLDTTPPTVTISPNGGTFATSQQVTLSASEAAAIYYTLDGSTPTVSSTVYSAPITLSATTTLKYFAKDTAGNSSAVQSATFTKDVAAPPDTTAPNDVTNLAYTNLTQTGVRLTWTASSSSDVSSYEIFNGATNIGSTTGSFFDISGLTAGTVYTFTVKAKDGATNISTGASVNVTTVAADTTAPTITASPVAGTFSSAQSVTLSANETATIYYTTDGTTPTVSSSVYSTPISISTTKTLKYFGKDVAGNTSTVQSQVYTINIGTAPGTVLLNDTFTRADSTTLGVADTGQTWTAYSGANGTVTMGIKNNTAYYSGGTWTGASNKFRRFSKVNVASNNFVIDVKTHTPTSGGGQIGVGIRVNGADDNMVYLRKSAAVGQASSQYTLVKFPSGGSTTTIGTGTSFAGMDDNIKIEHYSDGTIKVYINGTLEINVVETMGLTTNTTVGFALELDTGAYIDDFKVTQM